MNSKPSKMDIYKAKLSEREFYEKSNMFDYFGRSGGGAPLKEENGIIRTNRRNINYEDTLNQNHNQQTPLMNNAFNQQYDYQQNQSIMNKTPIQNVYPNQPYQLPLSPNVYQNNRPVSYHPPLLNESVPPVYYNQNQSNYNYIPTSHYQQSNPPSQINTNPLGKRNKSTRQYEQNGAPQYNNNLNACLGILPQDRPNDKLDIQKKILKEDWLMQIEEKKKRENEEKKRKLEEDQLEEGKWVQYIEEQKKREKQETIKKATESFPMSSQQNNITQQNDLLNQSKFPSNLAKQNQNENQSHGPDHSFQTVKQQNEPPQNQYQRMLNMNYANLGKTLDDNIQEQIAKLRLDVNSQYIEMSEMFNKLKMDVCEANQLKSEAERELQYIRDELLKQKMQNILYETKLTNVLEKNAPYNNLHIPLKEVDPMYNSYNQKPYTLRSTSDMVYSNDIVDERATNRTKQLSNLAQVGQSLVGESEFVPIPDNTNRNKTDTSEPTNRGRRNENAIRNNFTLKGDGNQLLESAQDESIKVLDSFMKKGEYQDMYNKLSDIANINHQIDPLNKCNTLTKNLEIDYKMLGNNQRNDEEIKKLDDMLNQLVENTNQY